MSFENALQILTSGPFVPRFDNNNDHYNNGLDMISLEAAVVSGDVQCVRRLLADHHNSHPVSLVLRTAIQEGHLTIVALLLAHGADYLLRHNDRFRQDHRTALHLIASMHRGEEGCNMARLILVHVVRQQMLLQHGSYNNEDYNIAVAAITRKHVERKDEQGRTALYFASQYGNSDMVRLLLEHGANVHTTTSKGQTAFHAAASHGHVDILRLLLAKVTAAVDDDPKHGNDDESSSSGDTAGYSSSPGRHNRCHDYINLADQHGRTALALACRYSHLAVIRYLLHHACGANINGESSNHIPCYAGTPLSLAIRHGRVAVAELLVTTCSSSASSSVTITTTTTQTLAKSASVVGGGSHWGRSPPLHMAIQQSRIDLVKILLLLPDHHNEPTRKQLLEQTDHWGRTALQCAVSCNNNVAMVELLLDYMDRHDDDYQVDTSSWNAALVLAVAHDRPDATLVRLFLGRHQRGVLMSSTGNNKDNNNNNNNNCMDKALLVAVEAAKWTVARLLLEHGVVRPSAGAFVAAVTAGLWNMTRLLLDHGADPSVARDLNGRTALWVALSRDDIALATLLLDYGANPNTICDQDELGRTELHRAAVSKNGLCNMKLLLKYGADTSIQDRDGNVALNLACEQQNVEYIFLLFKSMVGAGTITFK